MLHNITKSSTINLFSKAKQMDESTGVIFHLTKPLFQTPVPTVTPFMLQLSKYPDVTIQHGSNHTIMDFTLKAFLTENEGNDENSN